MPKRLATLTPQPDFAQRLVDWQRIHGRHSLPWQGNQDPYRVWLSEIMLQQTQVSTVIDYYQSFLLRFPSVADLAQAEPEEVMAMWSGLGYYSRARHMHRCAQQIMQDWGGLFPRHSAELAQLSGIGPSTAAAIASICHSERVAIFDGNVQRVLARHTAFGVDLAQTVAVRELQQLAQQVLPQQAVMPTYTQAIMDLGATVCTPRQPRCDVCPVASDCQARALNRATELPLKTRKIKRQSQSWWLLMVNHPRHGVWLQQRPQQGIWAGLYCFPCFDSRERMLESVPEAARGLALEQEAQLHVLTHRDLHLHLCRLTWSRPHDWPGPGLWLRPSDPQRPGVPKPVRDWLDSARDDV
ncbi:MAG: A/G-specific adenine glycosylase [Alphaproteobacteria bacterium]|nr:A/G-specific adenine glycosylase [Alphaproteobacteria bacterium]